MIELRPYQRDSLDLLYEYLGTTNGNGIIVLPTGAGKSIIIAEFIRRALMEWPDTKVLVLAHVKELLVQNMQELIQLWPAAPAGIYSAGLGSRNLRSAVTFGGIQSIYKRGYDLQRVDIVIIDECHLLSPHSNSMYRKLIADLLSINPYLRIIGLSATPYRMDSGSLTVGDDALFSDIIYEANLLDLIADGYLSPLVTKYTQTKLDTSGVAVRGGEFVPGALEAAVDKAEITRAAVTELVEYGQDRRSWLVFASGVSHALHVRDEIRERGISCETITGETPTAERAGILEAFKRGEIQCLTNANVLTTGVNVRSIDLLAFLRPTKSAALYVQMAGRGMRLSPETGKADCLVLDYARVVATHGPVDQVKPRQPGEGTAPVKECPECEERVFASARICPCCGFEFPPPVPVTTLQPKAEALPILSDQARKSDWVDVTNVSYRRHEKEGKPPSMVVVYQCGMVQHRVWWCPEHTGFARQKFVQTWQRHAPGLPVPSTVAEALANAHALRKPSAIHVRPNGKYIEVIGEKL